ncbi:MAG: helix-turn-helix transcriptional regulator [Methanobacteriota archaeon]
MDHLPDEVQGFITDLASRLLLSTEPGREVKALRDRYGFTQESLAGLVQIRRESLSRIESGHVQPSTQFLQRFSRIMTLAYTVRNHLARVEQSRSPPDYMQLFHVAAALDLPRETSEEVILTSTASYNEKRQTLLKDLGA